MEDLREVSLEVESQGGPIGPKKDGLRSEGPKTGFSKRGISVNPRGIQGRIPREIDYLL